MVCVMTDWKFVLSFSSPLFISWLSLKPTKQASKRRIKSLPNKRKLERNLLFQEEVDVDDLLNVVM